MPSSKCAIIPDVSSNFINLLATNNTDFAHDTSWGGLIQNVFFFLCSLPCPLPLQFLRRAETFSIMGWWLVASDLDGVWILMGIRNSWIVHQISSHLRSKQQVLNLLHSIFCWKSQNTCLIYFLFLISTWLWFLKKKTISSFFMSACV